MRVVFCSSEVVPFAKTGGLADVCGALPMALEKIGVETVVILPRYQCIDVKEHNLTKLNNEVSVGTIGKNIQVYFIEHEGLFDRNGLYGDASGDYEDNLDRFQFFCLKALELLKQLNISVDIVHCHDWQTSLIPVYLKTMFAEDEFYSRIKSVLTIHNLAYQGLFTKEEYPKVDLPKKYFASDGFEFYEKINLLKAGILFSDFITTVSPEYAKEIQTEKMGCGLSDVLGKKKESFVGILNGVDYNIWNPETDALIENQFCAKEINGKLKNKQSLQERAKLSQKDDVPVIGFVGRLDYQKGIDIIAEAMETIMTQNVQVILLGLGEEKYQNILRDLGSRYPEKLACFLKFDEELAHLIYAGSDMFLMPSRYEPCGLSQMISLMYGTIPVVFKTGGLVDTIRSYDDSSGKGNGFVFEHYSAKSLADIVKKAVSVYRDSSVFSGLVEKAFTYDFSWDKSAKEYQEMYEKCIASD